MKIERVNIGENGAVLTAYIQKNAPEIKNADRRAPCSFCPAADTNSCPIPKTSPLRWNIPQRDFRRSRWNIRWGKRAFFPRRSSK